MLERIPYVEFNYHKSFVEKGSSRFNFVIHYPFIYASVNENMDTLIEFAQLIDVKNEENQIFLPYIIWITECKENGPRLLEGEQVVLNYDYSEVWDLNNISYKK